MATVTAIASAIGNGCKLAWTLFQARNSPAMQDNARAATLQKIHASVDQHIASQNTLAVQADIAS